MYVYMAQGYKRVTVTYLKFHNLSGNWIYIPFPLEEMKYFIFSFFHLGVETQRGVEIRH